MSNKNQIEGTIIGIITKQILKSISVSEAKEIFEYLKPNLSDINKKLCKCIIETKLSEVTGIMSDNEFDLLEAMEKE